MSNECHKGAPIREEVYVCAQSRSSTQPGVDRGCCRARSFAIRPRRLCFARARVGCDDLLLILVVCKNKTTGHVSP
jgi:hypothetical protein